MFTRDRLVRQLKDALSDLEQTASERDITYRAAHSEGVIQMLLLTLADCFSDDEEIKVLFQQVNDAWGKAIVGKRVSKV